MKKLVCEVCSSNDIMKQDGVFICQSCGCKYSADDVKNLFVDDVESNERMLEKAKRAAALRTLANQAYTAGNYEEAYNYYSKVVELDPEDYDCVFYKWMSVGQTTTLSTPKIDKALSGYFEALKMIPADFYEFSQSSYLVDLITLIKDYYELGDNPYFDMVGKDWYAANIKIFQDYQEVCVKVIGYLDRIKTSVFTYTTPYWQKEMAELYCQACSGACTYVVQWKNYQQTEAIFPGLPLEKKKPFLDKYDDMVFEMRKTISDFRKIDTSQRFVYGYIDRMNPPFFLGPHNKNRSKENTELCIEADQETDTRVRQWRENKERIERIQKETKYWSEHPDAKARYDELKAKADSAEKDLHDIEQRISAQDKKVIKHDTSIKGLEWEIEEKHQEIAKLQKKIFGRAKHQEEIKVLEEDIRSLEADIDKHTIMLEAEQKRRDDLEVELAKAHETNEQAGNEFRDYQSSIGMM